MCKRMIPMCIACGASVVSVNECGTTTRFRIQTKDMMTPPDSRKFMRVHDDMEPAPFSTEVTIGTCKVCKAAEKALYHPDIVTVMVMKATIAYDGTFTLIYGPTGQVVSTWTSPPFEESKEPEVEPTVSDKIKVPEVTAKIPPIVTRPKVDPVLEAVLERVVERAHESYEGDEEEDGSGDEEASSDDGSASESEDESEDASGDDEEDGEGEDDQDQVETVPKA